MRGRVAFRMTWFVFFEKGYGWVGVLILDEGVHVSYSSAWGVEGRPLIE